MMSDVAARELCEELYKLSGWQPDDWYEPRENDQEYLLTYEDVTIGYGGEIMPDATPAYTAGYLLRKLLPVTNIEFIEQSDGKTLVLYYPEPLEEAHLFGDTPEDALASLAIELFKQGILTKVEQNEVQK